MHPFLLRSTGFGLNTLAALSPALAGKKGFELFCRPFRGKLKPHHFQFFQSARQFSLAHAGKKVQCYQWGTGPKSVLLLHGWQSHSFRWRSYVELLVKSGYSVYAMDAPGHGLSQGNQLNLFMYSEILQELLCQHVNIDYLITHSFGGYASIFTLYKMPQLPVKKLVLMGTPGSVADFMELYQQMLGLSKKARQAIIEHFVAFAGHPPAHFEATNLVQGFSKPVLFVHDTEDKDAPYHHAVAMHKLWENATLLTTNGLGHELKSPELAHQVLAYLEEE